MRQLVAATVAIMAFAACGGSLSTTHQAASDQTATLATAAARQDAGLWASAWTADGQPEADVAALSSESALAVLSHMLRSDSASALHFVAALQAAPVWSSELADDVVSQIDRRLYQLYYAASFEDAVALRLAAAEQIGPRFAWRKHEVAAAWESRDRTAPAVLEAVSQGDISVVHALAVEFTSRGAHRSAAGCWRTLAYETQGDEKVAALLAAADSEYALGRRDAARALIVDATSAAPLVPALPGRIWEMMARRRDGPAALELLDTLAQAQVCDLARLEQTEALLRVEAALVEAMLAHDPRPERIEALRVRVLERVALCHDPRFSRDIGLQIAATFRFYDALPLLIAYDTTTPGDAEVSAALIIGFEWADEDDRAGLAAARLVEARTRPGFAAIDELGARAILDVLQAGSSSPVVAVRHEFLRTIVDRTPSNRAAALAWASELQRQGLDDERRTLLQRYVEANNQAIEARFYVAFWMAENVDAAEEPTAALRALASDGVAAGLEAPIPHRGADSMAEAAWLRIFDLAQRSAQPDRDALDAIAGLVALRSGDVVAAWQSVWDEQLVAGWIGPAARARILNDMTAAGVATSPIWSALAIARFESHDDAGAITAWVEALRTDATAIAAVVSDIERVGALRLALDVLDQSGVDDQSARTARMRLEVQMAIAAEPAPPWEKVARRIALDAAVTLCLARGCAAEPDDAPRLDAFDLPHAALAMRLARLDAGWRPDASGALSIALNLLDTGAAEAAVAEWLEKAADTRDIEQARAARDELTRRAYYAQAAAFARLEIDLRDTRGRGGLNTLTGVSAWFAEFAPDGALRAMVEEILVAPAEALLNVAQAQPTGYSFSSNRNADAALLLTLAASIHQARGNFDRALALADRALLADPEVPGRLGLVCDALGAVWRANLTVDEVEAAVGRAGGGVEDFEEAADAMGRIGRPDLAAELLSRAMLVAPDDLPIRLALAGAQVAAGDFDAATANAEWLVARLVAGRAGDDWLDELDAVVIEGLLQRGAHDHGERLRRVIVEARPNDLRELALAESELARGALDLAQRRADRVVARGSSSVETITALHRAGFAGLAVLAYERAAPRLSLFEHFDLRSTAGLAWARRNSMAEYIELLRTNARSTDRAAIRPWLVEELGYHGMTREAADWIASAQDVLSDDELLLLITYDLALGEDARALQSAIEILERNEFGANPPWHALFDIFGSAGHPELLLEARTRAEQSAGAPLSGIEPVLYAILGGDADVGLQYLAEAANVRRDADNLIAVTNALGQLGYGAEANSLLAEARGAGAELTRMLFVTSEGLPERAIALTDPTLKRGGLWRSAGELARAPAPTADVVAEAREFARVGAFVSAADTFGTARALGARPAIGDSEWLRWMYYAEQHDALLLEIDDLPDLAQTERAACELLAAIDLFLDAELGVALGERCGGVAATNNNFTRFLVALWLAGRDDDAVAAEHERLTQAAWHPAQSTAMIAAYRSFGLNEQALRLARAAAGAPRHSARLFTEIALAEAGAGNTEAALHAVELGSALAPDVFSFLGALTEPMLALGAYDVVESAARAALDIAPEAVDFVLLRAIARIEAGDASGIDELAGGAARPDINPYWFVRAIEALVRTGAYSEAGRYVDRLHGVFWPNDRHQSGPVAPSRWSAVALSEWAEIDARSAREYVAEHAPHWLIAPETSGSDTLMARVFELDGDVDAAVDVYRRELVLHANEPTFYNNLAYVWAVADRQLDEALDSVTTSIATDSSATGSTIDTYGWVLYRLGRFAEAGEALRLAIRLEAARISPDRWLEYRALLVEHLEAAEAALAAAMATQPDENPIENNRRRRRR